MKTGTAMIIERNPRTKTKNWIQHSRKKRRKEKQIHYQRYNQYYQQKNPSIVTSYIIKCPHCNQFPGFYPKQNEINVCKSCKGVFSYKESIV